MSFTDCGGGSDLQKLLVLFCVFWPFVTLMFLRRGRSPLPLLAALLPFALGAAVMWGRLANVIERMALVSKPGIGPAVAAGVAEALVSPLAALIPAVLIVLFSLVRRSAPSVDRFTAVMALATAVEVVAALLFTGWIAPGARQVVLALIWAGTALLLSLAIGVRMVVLARRPARA